MKNRRNNELYADGQAAAQSFLLTAGFGIATFLAAYQVKQGVKPVGNFVILLSYWTSMSSKSLPIVLLGWHTND